MPQTISGAKKRLVLATAEKAANAMVEYAEFYTRAVIVGWNDI
jgi:hypothetical protein